MKLRTLTVWLAAGLFVAGCTALAQVSPDPASTAPGASRPAAAPLPVIAAINRSTWYVGDSPWYRLRVQIVNQAPAPTHPVTVTVRVVPLNHKRTALFEESLTVAGLAPGETRRLQTRNAPLPPAGPCRVEVSIVDAETPGPPTAAVRTMSF